MNNFFTGYALHKLDPKRRVSVPASMRNNIVEPLVICFSLYQAPHLTVYQETDFLKRSELLSNPFRTDDQEIELATHGFTTHDAGKIDSAGRIALSQLAADHASLKKAVVITGHMDHFSIWDSKVYDDTMQKLKERVELRQALNSALQDGIPAEYLIKELAYLDGLARQRSK